jgi:GNAT superfamily N-acetyltransferase
MVKLVDVGSGELGRYADVPIAFQVESVLETEVRGDGMGGITMTERPLEKPYTKDYDVHPDSGPVTWPRRFDVGRWGFFLAVDGSDAIGAAAVAFDTPGVDMLCCRRDLAVLWDIRVRPRRRQQGVGTLLFEHVSSWARERGCLQLRVETQNINVPACRFYVRRGCRLGCIDLDGYFGAPEVAGEVKLIWCLDL